MASPLRRQTYYQSPTTSPTTTPGLPARWRTGCTSSPGTSRCLRDADCPVVEVESWWQQPQVPLVRVFDRFNAQEDHRTRQRGGEHPGAELVLFGLSRTHRPGHRQRAEQQHTRVDGAKLRVQELAASLKHFRTQRPENGIGTEQSTKEQNLRDQETATSPTYPSQTAAQACQSGELGTADGDDHGHVRGRRVGQVALRW